jgi:gamma-glutamylcyclotransferase (GGCT)/AIG2-like uncharacterized protein YtfP
VLPGYEQALVEITDDATVRLSGRRQHHIIRHTGRATDTIAGTVFELTPQEVESADKYEVSAYKRVSVVLGSGKRAWVYVDANDPVLSES